MKTKYLFVVAAILLINLVFDVRNVYGWFMLFREYKNINYLPNITLLALLTNLNTVALFIVIRQIYTKTASKMGER